MTRSLLIHATCVALAGAAGPIGVALRGRSGSGKSDLALRLIDRGATLVADDQSLATRDGDQVSAAAAGDLAGRIEVRGLGVVRVPWIASVRLRLLIDLTPPEQVERWPEREMADLLGVALPRLSLDPWPASAALKVELAAGELCRCAVTAWPSAPSRQAACP